MRDVGKHSILWDKRCGFPDTPPEELIHFRKFNSNIYSDELDAKEALEGLSGFEEEWIDLRPYMIEDPQKLSQHTTVAKTLEVFRTYHLRTLIIVNPEDDSIVGIITRKDLDRVMRIDEVSK